jgi:hypothetical protein
MQLPNNKGSYPKTILYPRDWCDPDRGDEVLCVDEARRTFEGFVVSLENFLGVQRTVVDIKRLWLKTTETSFEETFRYTYEAILSRESLENGKGFVKEYMNTFGRNPYVPPSVANRWRHGEQISANGYARALSQVAEFKTWFEKHMIGPDPDTLSTAIMVIPWTGGHVEYRDNYPAACNQGYGGGFCSAYIAAFSGGPEVVFPSESLCLWPLPRRLLPCF